jgi:glutamate-1-semialdehyde 2,1-aminomutase
MAINTNTDVVGDIRARYLERTPRSSERDVQAQRYLPGGDSRNSTYFVPHPIYMQRGEGCYLYDADGNRYLDFLNNYTSLVHGHAHPGIIEAAADQLMRGTVYGAAADPQVELARIICERVPSIERVRFTNSGTEATMMAIRAARAFTGKDAIIKMEGGYHGSHDFVEVSIFPGAELDADGLPIPHVEGKGIPSAVLDATLVATFNDLNSVETLLQRHADRVAAIILEPMPNAGGMIPPKPGYLAGLRALADKYGALLIFDEVVTFRLSTGGMQMIQDVRPDLTALAKIIGGGFPVGAFGGRQDIMDQFNPRRSGYVGHSGTFNGNNMTMQAGIMAMQALDQPTIDRINALGDRMRAGITNAFRAVGIRGQALGYGSMWQVHWTDATFSTPRERLADYMATVPLQTLFHLALLNEGIYIGPRGIMCISTPMSDAEVDGALRAIEATLTLLKPHVAEVAPQLIV